MTRPLPVPMLTSATRFTIVALLGAAQEVEFGVVRDAAELSDSALSKQASALEAAGYLTVRKGQFARRPRTWLALTDAGRTALKRHVAALNAIMAAAEHTLAAAGRNPQQDRDGQAPE